MTKGDREVVTRIKEGRTIKRKNRPTKSPREEEGR